MRTSLAVLLSLLAFKPGLYGMKSYQVRISSYADWIEHAMRDNAVVRAEGLSS